MTIQEAISSNTAIKIDSLEDYNKISPYMRGHKSGHALVPSEFPIYAVDPGVGLGYQSEPKDIWSGEKFKVVELKDIKYL